MEELITLNQLKAYDDEKTNIWHNNFTTNNLTADNAVINNATISGLNVANIVAGNAEIDGVNANNLNVVDLVANNASFGSVNANGKLGNNGQVLGKNNGVLEWMNVSGVSVDTDDFTVNNITINNSATVNGDVFTHKGLDVASTKIISEDDYNNLRSSRNDAFYITSPNGNMYFMGIKWAPSYVPPTNYAVYVDLPNMANNMQELAISTLTFTPDAVTNSFVNGGAYNGIYKKSMFGEAWDNSSSVGTQANTGSIITNANELYIIDASSMYYNCQNLTDTFISNPSLITNAPGGYDPLKYCINMASTFYSCSSFNQPVNIPNSVTNMASTFYRCVIFNQPVNIPNSVTDMAYTFSFCSNFNQPVNIPNSVTNMYKTFYNCTTLASSTVPIHISSSIALGNTSNYIYNCLVNNFTGIAFDPSRILNDL